jgi:hypothetical protein
MGCGVMVLQSISAKEAMVDAICAVCLHPISDEERWFRVREENAHLSCSEKYLRLLSEKRQQAKTAPPKVVPDVGG